MVEFLNVGFGNVVSADRVMAIITPESEYAKQMIKDAKGHGKLLDVTCGSKSRSVLVMDNGYVVLSSVQPGNIRAEC